MTEVRQRFLEWAASRDMIVLTCESAFGMNGDDRFICPNTSLSWLAWQAASTQLGPPIGTTQSEPKVHLGADT